MSALPERYQRYAQPAGQRPVYPAAVELRGERPAVKWVPSAENPSVMVPVLAEYVQPMQPAPVRDLTPQPLIDPVAQRMAAGGFGAGAAGAGIGWGVGQAAAGIAAFGGTTAVLAVLALWLLARAGGRGGTYIHHEQHTYVQQKWLGRTNVSNQQ